MASPWVSVYASASVSTGTTSPKQQGPDIVFLLKDTLSLEDDKFLKACKSVCLCVCKRHYKQGTPTQSVKISTVNHNFLIDY